jgi:hypothetical protein
MQNVRSTVYVCIQASDNLREWREIDCCFAFSNPPPSPPPPPPPSPGLDIWRNDLIVE